MSSSRTDWFPTPVWYFKIDDHQQLNSVLLAEIDREQQQDRRGEQLSNILGWHSTSDLHKRASFTGLTQIIDRNVLEVATFLHWDLQKISIQITTCWAIVNGKYASNALHNHPNSILSGVYYLKTPEKSGVLSFTDPRSAARMLNPPITPSYLMMMPYLKVMKQSTSPSQLAQATSPVLPNQPQR